MDLRFTVHSCSEEPIPVIAEFNGQPITAYATGLNVELVAEDGRSTLTPTYIPTDMAADRGLFTIGATVVLTFAPAE